MKTLLMFVNWNTLDGAAISEHIDREPLYSASEVSLYCILQTLVENNLLFPKYQSIYQVLQDKFSQVSLCLIAYTYAAITVVVVVVNGKIFRRSVSLFCTKVLVSAGMKCSIHI